MIKYKDKWCQEAYDKGVKEGRDFEKGKLTEAKELLRKLVLEVKSYEEVNGFDPCEPVQEAEQFLKETEQ